jgi:transcriptional regulator with XRE-family HTH domain
MSETTRSRRHDDEAGRFVVRARRLADLSQRDLAVRIGVSASTVSRIESGLTVPSIELFERILALAGLRLAVVDAAGNRVAPAPADAVRDNQGRRFPAHLDVDPPDQVPRERDVWPRYDRLEARAWYRQRTLRDRLTEGVPLRERPVDHPTEDELQLRRRLMRGRQPRVDAPPCPEPVCECPDACFEALCVADCTCQCEPQRNRLGLLLVRDDTVLHVPARSGEDDAAS